jgi:hypothetical protein
MAAKLKTQKRKIPVSNGANLTKNYKEPEYTGGPMGIAPSNPSSITTTPTVSSQYQNAMDSANAANEARYAEGKGKYGQIEDIYKPGGSFGAGQLAQIDSQKQRDVASGMQSLVGSGMANTTVAASLPQAWEQNVGSQARLNLADTQAQRYAGALEGSAGFIERRTDQAPNMAQYADLTSQASMGSPSQYSPQGGGSPPPQQGGGQQGGGQQYQPGGQQGGGVQQGGFRPTGQGDSGFEQFMKNKGVMLPMDIGPNSANERGRQKLYEEYQKSKGGSGGQQGGGQSARPFSNQQGGTVNGVDTNKAINEARKQAMMQGGNGSSSRVPIQKTPTKEDRQQSKYAAMQKASEAKTAEKNAANRKANEEQKAKVAANQAAIKARNESPTQKQDYGFGKGGQKSGAVDQIMKRNPAGTFKPLSNVLGSKRKTTDFTQEDHAKARSLSEELIKKGMRKQEADKAAEDWVQYNYTDKADVYGKTSTNKIKDMFEDYKNSNNSSYTPGGNKQTPQKLKSKQSQSQSQSQKSQGQARNASKQAKQDTYHAKAWAKAKQAHDYKYPAG